jgi:hypothetical protein
MVTPATPRRRAPVTTAIVVNGKRIVVISRPLPLPSRRRRRRR